MSIDLRIYCCQNSDCPAYGRRNLGNLSITSLYGEHNSKHMLRCSGCKYRFSETKGTVYFRSQKTYKEVDDILAHVKEGAGFRKTPRLVNVHRDTVTRHSRKAGSHSLKLHDELVGFPPLHN